MDGLAMTPSFLSSFLDCMSDRMVCVSVYVCFSTCYILSKKILILLAK